MAIIELPIAEPLKIPYATNQTLVVGLGNLVPEQIFGLVPCQPLSENPCYQESQCMPVFATESGILERENDKSGFLFQMPSTSAHSSFKLQKLNHATNTFATVETLDTNTYGTFYQTGSLVPYTDYSGYLVDWQKVLDAFGQGYYRFVVQANDLPNPPFDYLFSYPFNLRVFTCNAANGTFYMEHVLKTEMRNILKQKHDNRIVNFDTVSLTNGWYDRCRYYGMIGKEQYELNPTYVKPADNSNRLVYTENVIKKDVQLNSNLSETLRRALFYGFNGRNIYITDNNDYNTKSYEKIEVILDSIETPEYFNTSINAFDMVIRVKNAHDITSSSGGFL